MGTVTIVLAIIPVDLVNLILRVLLSALKSKSEDLREEVTFWGVGRCRGFLLQLRHSLPKRGPASFAMPQIEQRLSDDPVDHIPMDIRQAEIPARIPICQPFVIETQQIQDGRVKVVEVNLVLH